ncbi:exopolyphosphatase / guanosine-5'-triphosphate,3'-diphosphate pyrophosphatase [Limimonas halophila]|uniref:Exopolyphosphatase / guanosine-5'-triphosphate,3'-diphosphate pyrophosphatase n=1 Tax=Limimonas halophila TaxID=1082479 RepID=A0A1G7P855_9PROT|nr:Ppx/GppA family phosphatase [Limimonas halophila]SDF82327.1 exopolyphosphatase / guanosine-5'-triphosphate,3'-diphosphate pyrophosphatase [Limimonas halophila]
MSADTDAPGTAPRGGRVAVVDIGSNSIRLVVFDRLACAPIPVFNEAVQCGLGRGLDRTGRLNEDGIAAALQNLTRFARLATAMGVARFDLLATAAVRDAENGAAFVAEVERCCQARVTVLSGTAEARLSGLGVMAGTPGAAGITGDLGGGSLELVRIADGAIQEITTLPLGPIRLMELAGSSRKAAMAEIDRHLDTVDWLGAHAGETFYPVGGAWRALARVHMEQSDFPLHVIHGYTLPRATAAETARVISQMSSASVSKLKAVPKKRRETMPYAALVLYRVLKRMRPAQVRFSAFGLREGHIFDLLPAAEQARDPLLAAASRLAAEEGRFGDLGPALEAWTRPLVPDETAEEARLRQAACHLADIAWREHPDYRQRQALDRILRLPPLAMDHQERAFLAYTVYIRYGGKRGRPEPQTARQLMTERQIARAEVLGLALRLGITVSGGVGSILEKAALRVHDATIAVALPEDGSVVPGDALHRRLKRLAKATGRKPGEVA